MAVVMVVTAVLVVVVMAVVIGVVMFIAVMMIMRRVTVRMVVRISSRVSVIVTGVGAALGVERRFDLDHPCAQPLDHRFDNVVAPDAQSTRRDLCRQMAVAEMPAEAHQMLRVVTPDFQKRLWRCHDFDQPAILEHERIATTQRDGMLEIEQEFKSARAGHRHPPPVAIVKIKHDRIG